MIKHNIDKTKATRQPIAPIVAECNCAAAKSKSADQAAGLPMKATINKHTIFRLISNMWTLSGLTNGCNNLLHHTRQPKRHPSLPVAIIATFNSYIGPPFLPVLATRRLPDQRKIVNVYDVFEM